MADDAIKYDYEKLELAFEELVKIVAQVEQTLDDQRSQVRSVMADWHGNTADAYQSLCNDLDKDMDGNLESLLVLKKTAHEGAARMQQADADGSKRVSL
ncbi:hypothetical protein SD37_09805 [Amycolatopsis orientalis]|uniref:ESAT-6-like protein n=1 Tax=Amycolatopsis orientalis TaxID=31958 RepID=A0A193BUQ7_AMYOR|nr:WXG100 family type VII secretion target [Amycolatopsis orientalis]ANN15909.1 hypothetical protein SD37_09805 [Amycolatopsis orientalis]